MKTYLKVVIAGAMLALSTNAFAQTCKVTDPTGTPLKVRTAPYGKVIGKLSNGKTVYISDIRYDRNNKPWALAFDARTDRYLGWVYRDYISCYY